MLNLFLKFSFSSGRDSCMEDSLYDIISCVEFSISEVRLNFCKWLSVILYFSHFSFIEFDNVFKTRLDIELEKLSVHGSLVGPVVKPLLNRRRHKYIIYILLKLKIIFKYLKYI